MYGPNEASLSLSLFLILTVLFKLNINSYCLAFIPFNYLAGLHTNSHFNNSTYVLTECTRFLFALLTQPKAFCLKTSELPSCQ